MWFQTQYAESEVSWKMFKVRREAERQPVIAINSEETLLTSVLLCPLNMVHVKLN